MELPGFPMEALKEDPKGQRVPKVKSCGLTQRINKIQLQSPDKVAPQVKPREPDLAFPFL